MEHLAKKIVKLLPQQKLWQIKLVDPNCNGSYENKFMRYIRAESKQEAFIKFFDYLNETDYLDLMVVCLVKAKHDSTTFNHGEPCYPTALNNMLKKLGGKDEQLIEKIKENKDEIIGLLVKYDRNLYEIGNVIG